MDGRISSAQGVAQGDIRTESGHYKGARSRKARPVRKPGRRRKAPEPDPVSPIDLLAGTVRHFFPSFNRGIDKIEDPRCEKMITYSKRHLFWEELLMFLGGEKSRNQMVSETLRPGFLDTLLELTGTEEEAAAHPDTSYWLFSKLAPTELVGFQAKLLRRLFRMRCLEDFRFGREWLLAVDGTWLRSFKEKHCDKCLHQKQSDGSTIWFHAILEAKLILSNGMCFSLASVPIENSGGEYDKQDCEQKAFPRLAEKLKELFPRLPICLLGDSLYGCAPIIDICEKKGWSYFFTFKKGRTPALWKRAVAKAAAVTEQVHVLKNGTEQRLRWATMLEHQGHTVHAIISNEIKPDGTKSLWAWLTDHRPDRSNVSKLANQGGRRREQIEQQFNIEKNGEFRLKHDYGSDENAWYNTYLLVQVAHMLLQLIQSSDLVRKLSDGLADSFTAAFRTVRNFISRMRESIQRDRVAPRCCGHGPRKIQIRFLDSS